MARLYDAIEPEVISMIMIQQSVIALRADAENVIPKEDKIDYSQVDAVRLDFRSKSKNFSFDRVVSNSTKIFIQIF